MSTRHDGAVGRIRRQQRRLGIALLEELHDHGRLRQRIQPSSSITGTRPVGFFS